MPLCRSLTLATALATLLGTAACQPPVDTGEVAQPVVGAEIDLEDPAVAALVFSNGNVFCTGTLVSPRVILTASHCIDDASSDPNFSAYFGSDTEGDDGIRVSIDLKKQHPMWTGSLGGGKDVGLLRLTSAQDPALAVPINTADLVDYIGVDYRVVGFGIHDRDTRELDGKKRTGVMSIARLEGDYLEAEDPDTIICQGDSGGPGFITIDGTEYLAGTHSYSISGCLNPSGDARPDLHHDDFIVPWIEDNDPSCGLDGLCAPVGCQDDPDCQPCGADGACTADCALPDVDCATSELGEICQADSQCVSELCVFWTGDPHSKYCSTECSGDGECPSGMSCTTQQPFGQVCTYDGEPPGALGQACDAATECSQYVCADSVCTYACDLGAGSLCPAAFECKTRDDGANYYCWPLPTEGGCSTGGGDALGLLLGLGAALAGLGLRRRGTRA